MVELTAQDMAGVNAAILEQLNSDVQLINQLGYYIVSGGGKRIRPMIAVLAARAVGYEGNAHVTIAALIEFIHTATLLHDDVVDESDMRRGKATANAAFGNAASVLVGDFIYTRAFQMMTSLGSLKVLEVMSEAVNVIAEGEVLQLMNVNDPDITEENYMRVIYSKTARLFEAAAQCSGILAGCTPEEEKGLQDYGRYLGTAFQLIDDLLDYNADGEQLGKNVGDDLNEGKPTLPLLHAMHHGTPEQAQMIRTAIEQGNGRHLLEPVLEAMNACGSLEWTRQRAEEEADKAIAALQVLPDTNYQQTHFVMSAPDIRHLPSDTGIEVAFAGRSNAGKSSALNTLTNQKSLARTSKTPGRTQLINLFEVADGKRLVDLPGYGYAEVPEEMKRKWQRALGEYLEKRQSLQGLVVLMDIRHPLKDLDQQMIEWAVDSNIAVLVLLTKADKLASGARKAQLNMVREAVLAFNGDVQVETFSSLKKQGVDKLRQKLDTWFSEMQPVEETQDGE